MDLPLVQIFNKRDTLDWRFMDRPLIQIFNLDFHQKRRYEGEILIMRRMLELILRLG